MQDVRESLKRALIEQGWIFGDKAALNRDKQIAFEVILLNNMPAEFILSLWWHQ